MYDHLTFNSPLSDARADTIAARLAATAPSTVLDIGCGWGELLLRVVAAAPGATGIGIDLDGDLLARARANAKERGLDDRVTFVEADGSATNQPADVVICVGAEHVFGDTATALRALRQLVRPGGRLLFGPGYLEREPTPAQQQVAGDWFEELGDLASVVDQAVEAGFSPLVIETSNRDEWDAFESGYLAGLATRDKARADEHRSRWLRGYRDVLGLAYLTLT